jgi:anti-sigma factor RsiW
MKAHDRSVAGIRCTEVLADLSDYFDGELTGARKGQIEAHLGGCDWCERFGGDFSAAITALRRELGLEPPDPRLHQRLMERLELEER